MGGLRVYEEDTLTVPSSGLSVAPSPLGPSPKSTPLKTSAVLSATPMNAFMCVMSCGLVGGDELDYGASFDPFENGGGKGNKAFKVRLWTRSEATAKALYRFHT